MIIEDFIKLDGEDLKNAIFVKMFLLFAWTSFSSFLLGKFLASKISTQIERLGDYFENIQNKIFDKKLVLHKSTEFIRLKSRILVVIEKLEKLNNENRERQQFLDLLIDSLEQIVIVTNGSKLDQANKRFFEFFEVKNIQEFNVNGFNCICDAFQGESQIYTQKKMGNLSWTDYILTHRDKENIVQIIRNNEKHIFLVTVTALYHNDIIKYVAIFSDITERENRERQLIEQQKIINDSITYASYIQNSIIPNPNSYSEIRKQFFSDSFFLWKPRDTVSGDIFFIDQLSNDEILIVVADCTGHGVAGAFITMLVKAIHKQLLNYINDGEIKKSNTGEFLSYFNRELKTLLNQLDNKNCSTNVGFDGGILYFNKMQNIVKYSGAQTPIFYIQNGNIEMIKGDRQSIGYRASNLNFKFTEYIFDTNIINQFYIMTDGFYDQIGSDKKLMFGKHRVTTMINYYKCFTFEEQKEIFFKTFCDYRGDYQRLDDLTFIGFKLLNN